MKKVIGAGVLVFFLYFVKDYGRFYPFAALINIAFIISFIYLIVVIIQYVRQSSKPSGAYTTASVEVPSQNVTKTTSSGGLWIVGLVATAVLIFFLKEMLGRNSFKIFIFLDNLVKFSRSIPPFIGWILPGLLVGAIYGSIVAWKKFKLNFTINLFPIGAFILFTLLLAMINNPFSGNLPDSITSQTDAETDINTNSSVDNLILNRWQVVDVTGKNRKNFLKLKSQKKSELEFKDNGKCYLYENGVTTGFVFYTIQPGGKSMEFKDPGNRKAAIEIEILSITKNELKIKSSLFENGIATLNAK